MPQTSQNRGGDGSKIRHRRSRSRAKKILRWMQKKVKIRSVILLVIALLIVVALVVSILVADAQARLNSSWDGLTRALNTISRQDGTELTLNDFNRLQASLGELSRRVNAVNTRIGLVAPIANLNPEWRGSIEALRIADNLASAADAMLAGLEPTLNFMVEGQDDNTIATRISSAERVVELLELGNGRFREAENQLALAEQRLNNTNLNNVSSDLLLQIEQLRVYRNQLSDINAVLIESPTVLTTVLGLDGEKTYLVLAQNNDEIRPSGGYISTYGWFTVNSGRFIDFDYSATTATSPNPPPADFLNTFEIPDWWINYNQPIYAAWDGSWYADFPQTAQLALSYYNAGGNPHSPVDGVLAIDITGFELMLAAMGQVFVEEYNVIVTAENFRHVVYDIRAYSEGETPHKQFVSAVYKAIFEEWQSIEQSQTADLYGALLEGFQSRHIMVYFAKPEVNATIAQIGWDGGQATAIDHDYILVADANLGNKSNHSIDRTITYDARILPDGSLDGRLSIGYEYFAFVAEEDPAVDDEFHGPLNYSNLMQIFLPANTRIQAMNNLGAVTTILEPTYTQLITRTAVEYDSSQRYQISYAVPQIVDSVGDYQRYRLLVQKQPGARPQQLNFQLTLPPNAEVISTVPELDASYDLEQPILDFRLILDGNQWVEVIYKTGK